MSLAARRLQAWRGSKARSTTNCCCAAAGEDAPHSGSVRARRWSAPALGRTRAPGGQTRRRIRIAPAVGAAATARLLKSALLLARGQGWRLRDPQLGAEIAPENAEETVAWLAQVANFRREARRVIKLLKRRRPRAGVE